MTKSLQLFNEFGEPNITTNSLAEHLNISPGNLYYHFRNKEDIVNSLFAEFEKHIGAILATPDYHSPNIEDAWLFLHLMFETIWRYRFLYRDLNDLLIRNCRLEISFRKIPDTKIRIAEHLCQSLQMHGELSLSRRETQAMATNMMVLATYWLSYEHLYADGLIMLIIHKSMLHNAITFSENNYCVVVNTLERLSVKSWQPIGD